MDDVHAPGTARSGSGPEGSAAELSRLRARVAELERLQLGKRSGEDHAWLRGALDSAQIGIWSWDVASGAMRWSESAASFLGRPAGGPEETYTGYLRLVHPDDRLLVRHSVESTLDSSAETLAVEHRLDGATPERWVEMRGRIVRDAEGRAVSLVGTFMEVTDRKRIEIALRSSDEAFRTLLTTVPSTILSITPDRKIRFLNRNLRHIRIEDVIGADVLELLAPVSRSAFADALEHATATGELQELEVGLLEPGGSSIPFLMRIGPVKKADTVEFLTLVGIDVTQLKRTEQALDESREQLRQAQRLESVGRLAGGVAHDFNNLLTVVTGCADLLEVQLAGHQESLELVRATRDAAERGAGLTRQLLAFARKQVVQPRRLDLDVCIRDAAELLRRLIGEDIELCLELSGDLPSVVIDPGLFEQVLVNLAVNARDAMPQGGCLTIASHNLVIEEGLASADRPAGDWISVTVEDTGTGISKEELPFIFEPFFTTKPAGQGTGLGLATCFGIVRQAGGHIDVESQEEGTRFRMLLPRASEAETRRSSTGDDPHMVSGQGTILLVEDDPMVRQVTRRVLQDAGYELVEAENGEEALALFESYAGRIDLVVSDIVMPKLNGAAMARRLLELDSDLYVLLVSGYSTELGAIRDMQDERVHVLQKPYSGATLTATLREMRASGTDAVSASAR